VAVETEEKHMNALTDHRPLLLVLGLGVSVGCADDGAGTTPVETTSETEPGTTATAETTSLGSTTGTTGKGTTEEEDRLTPWYGKWYVLDSLFTVNEPEWWGSGGDGLAFASFELNADSATIRLENCIWGLRQFEYVTAMSEDGVVVLEPVGGEHEYPYPGQTERVYIEPGADCSALVVREVRKGGDEHDFFAASGGPLLRGELCLEKCAEEQGLQGLISDCGTPVPWECPE